MSPTEAMLIRIADLPGAAAGGGDSSIAGGTGTGTGTGTGAGGGVDGAVVQAAMCSVSSTRSSRVGLVTEPDTHDIDLGRPEAAPRHI